MNSGVPVGKERKVERAQGCDLRSWVGGPLGSTTALIQFQPSTTPLHHGKAQYVWGEGRK